MKISTILLALAREAEASRQTVWQHFNLQDCEAFSVIVSLSNQQKKHLLLEALEVVREPGELVHLSDPMIMKLVCRELFRAVFRTNLQYNSEELITLYQMAKSPTPEVLYWFPISTWLKQMKSIVQKEGLKPLIGNFLKSLQMADVGYGKGQEVNWLKVKELLAQSDTSSTPEILPVLLENDAMGEVINKALAEEQELIVKKTGYALIRQFKKVIQSTPNTRFPKELEKIAGDLGREKLVVLLGEWLSVLVGAEPQVVERVSNYSNPVTRETTQYHYADYLYLSAPNMVFAKGLVWASGFYPQVDTWKTLAQLAEKAYQKIPGKGPIATAIGNACFYALAQGGLEGVFYLSRLKMRIKHANAQSLIEGYILQTATWLNITPEEVEDLAVPSYGLENGALTQEFDGYKVILRVEGVGKVLLTWQNPEGKALKSVPAAVKNAHASALKELAGLQKEIQKTLIAWRDRLDRSFVLNRSWSWQAFDQYYFSHGFMSCLTRQLIWVFEAEGQTFEVFYLNGQWVNAHDEPVVLLHVDKVTLWHPVGSTAVQVMAWREFLDRHQFKQVLKQAYREVYPLTDAEINTRTYSNRMAAHVLKQHQFNSLAKLRGWKYSLLGAYDKGYETEAAIIRLPDGYHAEYWVQEVDIDEEWNDTGIFHYVSTDQLRFYRNRVQVELAEVPLLMFSETMRDVDLFVGVASVGNDPNWRDGGLREYRNYWESYSFGDLGPVAKTRRQVLEKLIPKLAIARQCQFTDKFLVVKGQLRTYKIHLGSGNILMEPNDQYLCIVPNRSAELPGDRVFLPFEGDAILSIIISKALLLADDTKITDATIISQLKRR
jgi:hypothetical protein